MNHIFSNAVTKEEKYQLLLIQEIYEVLCRTKIDVGKAFIKYMF